MSHPGNVYKLIERPERPVDERALQSTAERMTLAALRYEIDVLDADLLGLLERRMSLAARVGRAKDAPAGPHLKLRPDREEEVQRRIAAQASGDTREAAVSLWREIIGWGLARQERLQVQVWAPIDPCRTFDGARRRFGAAAALKSAADPIAALDWAAEGNGVAVLAVNAGDPWWAGLGRRWSSLRVFEGFGGEVPTSLALGRIDPSALPSGPRVLVDAGGAGDGWTPRRRRLASQNGLSLSLTDAPFQAGGPEGCIGSIS